MLTICIILNGDLMSLMNSPKGVKMKLVITVIAFAFIGLSLITLFGGGKTYAASENGTETFDIERSTDGKNFKNVGSVAANGHSHDPQSYTFLDKSLPLSTATVFYYRLKVKDFDGASNFSPTRP